MARAHAGGGVGRTAVERISEAMPATAVPCCGFGWTEALSASTASRHTWLATCKQFADMVRVVPPATERPSCSSSFDTVDAAAPGFAATDFPSRTLITAACSPSGWQRSRRGVDPGQRPTHVALRQLCQRQEEAGTGPGDNRRSGVAAAPGCGRCPPPSTSRPSPSRAAAAGAGTASSCHGAAWAGSMSPTEGGAARRPAGYHAHARAKLDTDGEAAEVTGVPDRSRRIRGLIPQSAVATLSHALAAVPMPPVYRAPVPSSSVEVTG